MNKKESKSNNISKHSKIKIIGIGGAGISVINRMLKRDIGEVSYTIIDTDKQALDSINGDKIEKIQIGKKITKGDGTGMNFEKGKESALTDKEKLQKIAQKNGIVFIAAGLGGGTGSGAGPIVADICKNTNALTVGVLTKPFSFEGRERLKISKQAIKSFENKLDAFALLSNSQIMQVVDKKTSISKAFDVMDEAVRDGISLFANILNKTGIINVNLSDIINILKGAGPIFLGSGKVNLQDPAKEAGTRALENPLIEGLIPQKAKNILFVVKGPESLAMSKINDLAKRINKELRTDAKIIFGTIIEKNRQNIGVTLIGSHFQKGYKKIENKKESDLSDNSKIKKRVKRKKVSSKREVKAYGETNYESKKDLMENGNFEDELEIPAFLRKKIKD